MPSHLCSASFHAPHAAPRRKMPLDMVRSNNVKVEENLMSQKKTN